MRAARYIIAAMLTFAGAAEAATLDDVLASIQPIRAVSAAEMEEITFDDGSAGRALKEPERGFLLTVKGDPDDIDEMNLMFVVKEMGHVLAVYDIVTVATEDEEATAWASQALANLGAGQKRRFGDREVEFREVVQNVLLVSVSKVPD